MGFSSQQISDLLKFCNKKYSTQILVFYHYIFFYGNFLCASYMPVPYKQAALYIAPLTKRNHTVKKTFPQPFRSFGIYQVNKAASNNQARRKITRKNPPPPCTSQASRIQKDMGNLPTRPV